MGRITRLSPELANQIAAGEVVERPASVVKELVENSIDAGATRTVVAVEMGGKRRIRVEDDGSGMEPGDARLALERHATSKIARASDLEAIATMGFRGEALPSIASVSHFVLRTRPADMVAGTEITVNGGTLASVTEVGMAPGTIVEVDDLFYNLPARRKFLKSDVAETTQVSRMVTLLALGHPEIGFTLTSGPRTLVQCPPVASVADRFYQLYGDRKDLVPVRTEAGGLRVFGYVAALTEQGPVRGVQQFFVNRRIVRDRTIAHAVSAAYASATAKERSPEVYLFLELAPDTVDVNVHPTKAEVRFRHQSLVHEVVRRAVQEAVGEGPAPELTLAAPAGGASPAASLSLPNLMSAFQRTETSPGRPASPLMPPPPPSLGGPAVRFEDRGAQGVGREPATAVPLKPLVPLGQFRNTYIIAVDEEGIAVIDQHVAHERVLYERAIARLSSGALESQRLLTPLLLDVPPEAREVLLGHTGELHQCGFEVEDFGPSSVKVTAMPVLLGRDEGAEALRALSADLERLGGRAPVEDHLRQIAATMACHAAVKAHDPLTHEKMVHILEELRETAYSTVCPHGRPVMLRLSRREVEKNFQRI
ncbi:MAG: DNA mismatch repair endonuclease MutL [Acidobacteriota bacterium]